MKTVFLLLSVLSLWADEKDTSKDPEVRQVTVDCENVSLTAILADLEKQSGIPIEMTAEARKVVDPDHTFLSSRIRDLSLYKTLYLLLHHTRLIVESVQKKRILISVRP